MKSNRGFTLIELIAVIVILGILAVTAVPQFVDLRDDARNASAAGVGGAISSATTMNYAKGMANSAATTVAVTGCDATMFAPLMSGATAGSATSLTISNSSYTIGGTATGLGVGISRACTITHSGGGSAQSFSIIGCADTTGC
jgi:MSHA pilin protein MshA